MKGIIAYLRSTKKSHIILFSIIVFDLLLYTVVIHQKELSFCDELWSYAYANAPVPPTHVQGTSYFERWNSQKDIQHILSPTTEDRFSYSRVLYNLEQDVHAPVYYYIIHTISSIFQESTSIWIGLSINYIAFIFIMIYLFKSVSLLNSERTALIVCLIFSLSIGSIIQASFVRMYELLCAFSMICIYEHIVLLKPICCNEPFDEKQRNKLFYAISGLYLLAYLTHFSFIVFAGLLSFCSFILLCKKTNDIKLCLKYACCSIAPFIISFIILPKSFTILTGKVPFDGGRILQGLINADLLYKFHQFWDVLNIRLHFNYLILAGFISIFIFMWRNIVYLKITPIGNLKPFTYNIKLHINKFKISIPNYKILFFFFFSFIFITTYLLIIKTSYFPSIRYVWMIIPILYILIGLFIKSKYSLTIFTLIAILASIINIRDEKIDFLTKNYPSKIWLNENKLETILYYREINWLYFIGDSRLVAAAPRSYATTDLSKHIETSSDKVAVMFSRQLLKPGSNDIPLECIDTAKQALGFNEAKKLTKEHDRELWLFSKSDHSNTSVN